MCSEVGGDEGGREGNLMVAVKSPLWDGQRALYLHHEHDSLLVQSEFLQSRASVFLNTERTFSVNLMI